MRFKLRRSAMTSIFEGNLDLGAVGLDLAATDNHDLLHDFRYAQLTQMFSGLLDRVLSGFFPGVCWCQ